MNGVPMLVSIEFKECLQEIQRQRKKIDKNKVKGKISYTELTLIVVNKILNKKENVDLLLSSFSRP